MNAVCCVSLFCAVLCLSTAHMTAQDAAETNTADAEFTTVLDSAIAGMERVHRYAFTLDRRMKFMMSDDTTVTRAEVVLERLAGDPFGFRFYGFVEEFYVIYNGEQALVGAPSEGRMTRIPLAENPAEWIGGTFASSARFPDFSNRSYLQRLRESTSSIDRALRDTLWDGEPACLLCMTHKGSESIAGAYTQIVLRATDYFPVAITQDLDIIDASGMLRQHTYSAINNLRINPEIEAGLFDGATLPDTVNIIESSEAADTQPAVARPWAAGRAGTRSAAILISSSLIMRV